MEHKIEWGEIPLGRELNKDDIEMLMSRLNSKAKGCNAFGIELVPRAIEFIDKHVKNAHLIRAHHPTGFCVIGADKESAETLYNSI